MTAKKSSSARQPIKASQTKSAPSSVSRKKADATARPVASTSASQPVAEAARLIDERIRTLADWRGETLALVRRLIQEALPEVTEQWKWKGTPVWALSGNICTGETYKQVVKLTFPRGAALPDPRGLFNSSLEGNTRRAIDIREGDELNPQAFKTLVRAAAAENARVSAAKGKPTTKPTAKAKSKPTKLPTNEQGVVLLSGGNPQIAKGDGDAPVQAYIAAMPGWKSALGKQLDALITRHVPEVQKGVRWNSPFYGVAGQGWFLSFHVLTRYVKVTFFSGMSLNPIPPGGTERSGDARWIDIYEDDQLDEDQLVSWIKQAAAIPGWVP